MPSTKRPSGKPLRTDARPRQKEVSTFQQSPSLPWSFVSVVLSESRPRPRKSCRYVIVMDWIDCNGVPLYVLQTCVHCLFSLSLAYPIATASQCHIRQVE